MGTDRSKQRLIIHSCCPEKRDIVAPVFKLTETLRLAKGELETWECEGCKTIIMMKTDAT